MSANNNNHARSIGGPSPLGNSGMMSSSMPINHPSHLLAQVHHQASDASHFQGQFQSPLRTQTLTQVQAQHIAQANQAFHAQFPAQPSSLSQTQSQGMSHVGAQTPSLSNPGVRRPFLPPQKTIGRPPGSGNTSSPAPSFKNMELTPAARRKKRKLPEKHLPDKVAALLPESALYTQLLEFEARVDGALARKKIDIQESLKNPPCIMKTLRIYVFNTFSNQIRSIPERQNAEPPSWSLKIIGRILEDGADPDSGGMVQRPNPNHPKFSTFFKRITVSLDPTLYPDNPNIVWESARSAVPHEGFEIKRKGEKEFNVGIRLDMNYLPEKFKLSPALTEVLAIEVDTRARVIAAIWQYVKAKKLQDPNDPSFFRCDPPLRKVFGEERMKFGMVSQKISSHLSTPQPIILEHTIRLSGSNPAGSACYDVLVDVPFPLQKEMSAFLANTEKHKEIDTCDEAICAAIKKIHEHRRRRAFFLGFSQSPVEFINALIASQSRDLKLVAGEASRNAEKERHSDFYNQPWVEDAVIRYLNRKPAVGSDAPGST
ncbi:hypothetical protein ACHQM5_023859 [Ranunculus cassubicifolius]